jgi:Arc/MetJ-type ribon-helix-helix transcriptional regulator
MPTVWISQVDREFLKRLVDSGAYHSMAQAVAESLNRHRRTLAFQAEEAEELKAKRYKPRESETHEF